jgi:hypothetical protein
MAVVFGDDQRRVLTQHVAHHWAVLRQFVLNLLHIASVRRQGALDVQRLVAATADHFRSELLGLG